MNRLSPILLNIIIWVPIVIIIIIGNVAPPFANSGFGATLGWMAAGLFSAGILSAGLFSAGVYSAGLFSIGIFSAGVFSVGIFAFGTYAIGIWASGQYPVGIFTSRPAEMPSKK